jgi:hypothetical protein
MDANRGYIFLSSNYQYPECWEAVLELFTRTTLMAGSPKSDMGALRKEKEKITVHPFVRIF